MREGRPSDHPVRTAVGSAMAGSATEAAFLEELCQEPLFAAQGNPDRNVAKQYNQLIQSDCRTLMGALRYVLWHAFGQAGHMGIFAKMALAKERHTVSLRAYEGHCWVHDPCLQDVSRCSKSELAAMPQDYIKECCRDIKARSIEHEGQRWVRLQYQEIVAAFYDDRYFILRFCWGGGITRTYDAIVDQDSLTTGSPQGFLDQIEPCYKEQPVSESPDSGVRRTNGWANPMTVGPQCYVRIYDHRKGIGPWLRKVCSGLRR